MLVLKKRRKIKRIKIQENKTLIYHEDSFVEEEILSKYYLFRL